MTNYQPFGHLTNRMTGILSILVILQVLSSYPCFIDCKKSSAGHGHRKLITVSLESNWKETPLLLETSEFLWEELPNAFWSFVDAVHDKFKGESITSMTPGDEYSISLDFASDVLNNNPSRVSLLKFALSLRMYSPAVEMFNQMALTRLAEEGIAGGPDLFLEVSDEGRTRIITTTAHLEEYINSRRDVESTNRTVHPQTFKVDHQFPGSDLSPSTVVLYGQIGSANFYPFHKLLVAASKASVTKYFLRHYRLSSPSQSRPDFVSLSGYGVELAIKSTEYRSVDDTRVKGEESSLTERLKESETQGVPEVAGFRVNKLKELHADKSDKIDELTTYLQESMKEIATLKVWQLQELSLQLASKLLSSPVEDQLKLFQGYVQNFPIHAKSLINVHVDKDLRKEVEKNQMSFVQNMNLGTADTSLFLNGLFFDMDTVDVFSLYSQVRNEMKMVEGLHRILKEKPSLLKHTDQLLKLDVSSSSSSGKSDHFTIDFRDSAVQFINDLENDKMYKNWPSSIQDLLRPSYPGMLKNVRKNIYNLVMIIDASKAVNHDLIKLAESFYVHKAPLRVGFVFLVNEDAKDGLNDASLALLNVFNFINQEKAGYDALSFITDVIATIPEGVDITSKNVISHFKTKYSKDDVNEVFGPESEYDTGRKLAKDFLTRTGLGASQTRVLLNGVLLQDSHLNGEMFEEAVLTEIMRQTPVIQKAVYTKELSDSDDVVDWLMSQKSVLPRLNHHILKQEKHHFIDLSSGKSSLSDDNMNDNSIDGGDGIPVKDLHPSSTLPLLQDKIRYLTNKKIKCPSVSIWVAADSSTSGGRKLLRESLYHLREDSEATRIAIIHGSDARLSRLIESVVQNVKETDEAIKVLLKFLDDETAQRILSLDSDEGLGPLIIPSDYKKDILENINSPDLLRAVELSTMVYQKSLSASPGSSVVVVNGRVIPVPSNEIFTRDDFNLIQKYNFVSYGDKLTKMLSSKEHDIKGRVCSDLVMRVSSVLLSQPNTKTRHDIKYHSDKKSVLVFPPTRPEEPSLEITAIVEPLSRGAQKLIPLLTTLQKVVNVKIKIFLNCIDKHSDMPLKNFYRFVLHPELSFEEGFVIKRTAVFANMPLKPLFTLAMSTPENWLVEAVKSPYDLDNIHLEEVDSATGVWADFKLEYLLLEGHCFEQNTGNPPRGLQFVLSSGSDTIVMANLGYFQLKARPGSWSLSLRPGRSSSIYQIVSYEGPDVSGLLSGSFESLTVTLHSFKSHVAKIRVNKRPGQMHRDLLGDDDEADSDDLIGENSIWGNLWSGHSSKDTPSTTSSNSITDDVSDDDRIDIFSLATGHLYERLLRIMMVSVLKNTKSRVKFWFLKNYLSPTFKEFLPLMAQEYKFEYELVEYKWPRWLHQQTEKQRIIWGYKILFLDVLFPLNVSYFSLSNMTI